MLDPGHVTGVLVGEAKVVLVDELVVVSAVPVVPPVLAMVVEDDVANEVTNFPPQIPAFDTGAPRFDLR